MQILSNILAFVFALGVIVFVHESGHYLVAKAFGVRVLTFSLGFGRSLWSMKRGGTDYRLCWIPLGGYVTFAGQDPSERSGNPLDYPNQARWRRVLILVAGPAMNVVLAILLVTIVFATGVAVGDPDKLPAVLGAVEEGGAAQRSGLQMVASMLFRDPAPQLRVHRIGRSGQSPRPATATFVRFDERKNTQRSSWHEHPCRIRSVDNLVDRIGEQA